MMKTARVIFAIATQGGKRGTSLLMIKKEGKEKRNQRKTLACSTSPRVKRGHATPSLAEKSVGGDKPGGGFLKRKKSIIMYGKKR